MTQLTRLVIIGQTLEWADCLSALHQLEVLHLLRAQGLRQVMAAFSCTGPKHSLWTPVQHVQLGCMTE